MRISSPTEADVIAVIDGQTGAMLGARRYDLGPGGFDHSQVHGDVLWLNGYRVYIGLEDTAWLTLRLQDGLPVIYQNGDTEAPLVPMAIVR